MKSFDFRTEIHSESLIFPAGGAIAIGKINQDSNIGI